MLESEQGHPTTGAQNGSSALCSGEQLPFILSDNKHSPLLGCYYARYSWNGEPIVYSPYRIQFPNAEETIATIANAMKVIPSYERSAIATKHLLICETYRYPPSDYSWGLLHVTITPRSITSGYETELRPVVDVLTEVFIERNGVRA